MNPAVDEQPPSTSNPPPAHGASPDLAAGCVEPQNINDNNSSSNPPAATAAAATKPSDAAAVASEAPGGVVVGEAVMGEGLGAAKKADGVGLDEPSKLGAAAAPGGKPGKTAADKKDEDMSMKDMAKAAVKIAYR